MRLVAGILWFVAACALVAGGSDAFIRAADAQTSALENQSHASPSHASPSDERPDAPLGTPSAVAPIDVQLDRDNVVVSESARVRTSSSDSTVFLRDLDENGVLQIVGRDDGAPITIDLAGLHLVGGRGAADELSGIGISVRGRNVTLRNGRISGFRIGILAAQCDGLVLEDLDTSDNYAQRLRSRPWAEDLADWLFPHANDNGEWARQHGAGVSVREARGVTIRRITSHRTQNGMLLDRVARSAIYDNDCSFLSGWGLALWRSSGNTICRNNFDFCIRGYSHGVYNRGQDSAGILMFEQCSHNIIALNSATHGGDGVFGFAGREALGEVAKDGVGSEWYEGRGSNRNLFLANDLSFAAAHGLEITFSFGNLIARNRFESNAITGVWGGYSRQTTIAGNSFSGNGRTMRGAERGGINMEHARDTLVVANTFDDGSVGVRFWTDADPHLARLPWASANGMGATRNVVEFNTFSNIDRPLEILSATETTFAENSVSGTDVAVWADTADGLVSESQSGHTPETSDAELDTILARLPGVRQAIGLRDHLRGRDKIIMLDFGPYAWDQPVIVRESKGMSSQTFRLLGFAEGTSIAAQDPARVELVRSSDGARVTLRSVASASAQGAGARDGVIVPYRLEARTPSGEAASIAGVLATGTWQTVVETHPRSQHDGHPAHEITEAIEVPELNLAVLPSDVMARVRDASRVLVSSRGRLYHAAGRYRMLFRHSGVVEASLDGGTPGPIASRGGATMHAVSYTVDSAREVDVVIRFTHDADAHRTEPILEAWFEFDGDGVLGSGGGDAPSEP